MKATAKLSSEARRAAIIKAVRRVFAEKGFHGTTTRELADAAGVSEALLFKHFPNKEALFAAMLHSCCSEQDSGKWERLKALAPSAATLTILVHLFVSRMVGRKTPGDDEEAQHFRLMIWSLSEDGEFARLFLQGGPTQVNRLLEVCVKAAVDAGDAVAGPVQPKLAAWFGQHLAAIIKINLLPRQSVVDYGVARDQLVQQLVWFILRGMGLKEAAIKRYYNPEALALFAD
jgi:AcrR family transcriptional regulator